MTTRPAVTRVIKSQFQTSSLLDSNWLRHDDPTTRPSELENYTAPAISADASNLCTALGGDHNKDTVQVVDSRSLLLFLPETAVQTLRIVI